VRVGFFSFTEVTDPAAHGEYNRWHQLDHLPEQLPLPGVAFGQRWVSTPACRRARAVDTGRLGPVHYVTLYLMTDPVAETLERFAALGARLHAEGRFFDRRRSHLSGPFEVETARAAPRVLVSPAAVPYRPGTGIYVVVVETEAPDPSEEAPAPSEEAPAPSEEAPAPSEEAPAPTPLLGLAGVAGVWSFRSSPALASGRWRPGEHRVVVCFLDGDVLDTAGELAALVPALAGPGAPAVVFAGPFETIIPWRWDWFDPPRR
jgi:hypothetical protein